MMRIAAIDIGSNAARLLINEVTEPKKGKPEFMKLNLLRIPLRLGIDVFTSGKIGAEREEMVISSMKVFSDLMKIYKVEHYRACATSAMRDAKNGAEIIQAVKQTSGIDIEIISGDEEATLIYENHVAEGLDKDSAYLYIDVGGGSTELTFYENGEMKYERSFNIGTIRLLNHLVTDEHWKEMKEEIRKNINSKKPVVAIGSGGNINKIFKMSGKMQEKPLSYIYVNSQYAFLNSLSYEQRIAELALNPDRADVIIPATRIYLNAMKWSGARNIYVPKIGLSDGIVKAMYSNKI